MSAAAGAAPGTRRARVLAHLAAHPGLTTYELERALGTGPSTRELLHDMERKAQVIAVMEWRPQQGRHVSAWYVAPPGTVPAPSAERTEHLRRLRREAQRRRRARAAVMPGPAAVACLPPGAACKGADPALFFGAEAEKPWERPAREAEAKAICARCSIRLRCFDLARANGERWGIWGGVDFQGEGGRKVS